MKRFIFGVLLIIAALLLPACSAQDTGTLDAELPEISSDFVDEDSSLPAPSFHENQFEDSLEQEPSDSTIETVLPSVSPQEPAEEPAQPSYQTESVPNSKPDIPSEEPEPASGTDTAVQKPETEAASTDEIIDSEPTSESEPVQSQEPVFNIDDWITYAQEYGEKLGLVYDATATDCWDNPIVASGRSQYLERDIRSRLELYRADGMTYFCVWAQPRADGGYDLYIGYA